jgi:hypothetical protein
MPRVQEIVSADGTHVRRKPIAGDLRWDGTSWQRWSGRQWTRAAYALHPELLTYPGPFQQQPPVPERRRHRALSLAVEDHVAANAATVILDGPSGVVLAYRRPVSHFFHAVMTLLTGGLWAVVGLAFALGKREDRVRLEADAWGNVWARPVAAA